MMRNFLWTVLVLSGILLAACGTQKNNEPSSASASLENMTWRLVELDGVAVKKEINGKVPSLNFASAEKRYGAVTGCNGIGGQYEIKKGNQLSFSMGMSTKMYCEGAMEVEDGLGKLFPLVKSYEIKGNDLVLKGEGSAVLAKFVLMP